MAGKHGHDKDEERGAETQSKNWRNKYQEQRKAAANHHPEGVLVHCHFVICYPDLFKANPFDNQYRL